MTDQIFLIPTAFGKSSDLTVSGIGHSVIRGLVTNMLMVRREPCYLKAWIMITHANIVVSSSRKFYGGGLRWVVGMVALLQAPAQWSPIQMAAAGMAPKAGNPYRQGRSVNPQRKISGNMRYHHTAVFEILSVIIPHKKHAISLATAVTAILRFFPCLISL